MDTTLDINADMGEGFGLYRYGEDESIVTSICSCNLACGFHAGDPTVMRNAIVLARDNNVAVGAHFGFRDLAGFGRRHMVVKPGDLKNDVAYQLGALGALARAENVTLHHAKAHGAMYMMALEDDDLAGAIVEAILEFDDSLMIYTIHDSATDQVARKKGLRTVAEFFADRPYFSDGSVKMFGWSLEEVGGTPEAIGQRIGRLATEGTVSALDGREIRPTFETVCVHSDTPGSSKIAHAIRSALRDAGVEIASPRKAV